MKCSGYCRCYRRIRRECSKVLFLLKYVDCLKDIYILANLAIRGAKTPLQCFSSDVCTKSICNDLAGIELSCFTTFSTVTRENSVSWGSKTSKMNRLWIKSTSRLMIVSFIRQNYGWKIRRWYGTVASLHSTVVEKIGHSREEVTYCRPTLLRVNIRVSYLFLRSGLLASRH